MEFNGWSSFEDLAKACGYTTCDNNNTNEKSNDNETNKSYNIGCNDIPNGFQSLNPELFIIIGEILGNIVAGSIPFNVQNSIGNWLQLVGQAILTYNAQQQYFQGGPGRYFNTIYYNVNNPFCSTTSTNASQNANSSNNNNNNEKDSNINYTQNEVDKIKSLEFSINQLKTEIEEIRNTLKR